MTEREKRLEEVLLRLEEDGGLGWTAHERIRKALGTPNHEFCTRARDCLRAGRCTRDPVCTE